MANSVSKWLLTVPEVMEILGIGRTFTYSLINRGDLESSLLIKMELGVQR